MHHHASLILVNARVLTMDPHSPSAEAVAIASDKILAVGSNSDVSSLRSPRTEVIDCRGLPLIPGINDAHCHLLATAASLSGLDCGGKTATSLEELLSSVRVRAKEVPPGNWIRGFGLDPKVLRESRYPTRWELDIVAPQHPVRLEHASGHAAVFNSLGLEAAGIGSTTPDPVEGVIDRDPATAEPTGLLLEMAGYLRDKLGHTRSLAAMEWGVARLGERLLGYGVTSVQDAGPFNGFGQWKTLHSLVAGQVFRPRITMMAGAGKLEEFIEAGLGWASGDEWLRLGHAKIMLTLTTGDLHPAPDDLAQVASRALALGFPFAVHAVEQEALTAVLDMLPLNRSPSDRGGRAENINAQSRIPRNRIEHCAECPPWLMEKLALSDVTVVTQPGSIYWRGDSYLRQVDARLLPHLYRVDELSRRKINMAFGSDAPLIDPCPWPAIYAAVTRRTSSGAALPWSKHEKSIAESRNPGLDIGLALAAYTRGGAMAEGTSNVKGAIKKGMLADLALIDTPLEDREPARLQQAKARLTILGGKVVCEDGVR